MRADVDFFRPTPYKLIFTLEWVGYVLLALIERHAIDPDLLPVALWPLLLSYCLGCTLVAWSRHTDRVASGRGLVLLIVAMVAVDQASKALAVATLPPESSLPLVEGWLHLGNIHNTTGSWLGTGWLKPVLSVAAALVLPLSVIVYRYYVSTRRRSLWAGLAFLGIFAGYASWLVDILCRGYIVDVIHIPGLIAFDIKDLFLSLGICVVIEVLDNPGISLRFEGWRAERESTRRLASELAAFAAVEVRSWWLAALRLICGKST